jgi:hypothetical protein
MISMEDFTFFPSGFEVPLEGRVGICPTCGRKGIEEHPTCGQPHFLHRQVSETFGDGMRTEPIDTCRIPKN